MNMNIALYSKNVYVQEWAMNKYKHNWIYEIKFLLKVDKNIYF